MNRALDRFKLVVRDTNGKVIQIHECYRSDVTGKLMDELRPGVSVTVMQL